LSIFNEDTATTATSQETTEADATTQTTSEKSAAPAETQDKKTTSIFESLVGEGRKFRDAEALARGKAEADRYIESLKEELAQTRSALETRMAQEELLEEIKKAALGTGDTRESTTDRGTHTEGHIGSADELESLIEKRLSAFERERAAKERLAAVENSLKGEFGDKAGDFVKAKAAEYGMSMSDMEDLAVRSPNAFLSLMGVKSSSQVNNSDTETKRQNSESVSGTLAAQSGKRDWNYYSKLRRENKKKFFSPEIQTQMMQDRLSMGEEFFGT